MIDENKLIEELEKQTFSAEVYNDYLDGILIENLLCLGDATMEVIKRLEEQPKIGEWIPFDEIKPMHNQYVLSIDSNGEMEVMYFDKEWENCLCKWGGSLKTFNIVAWMPLPKAYEVEE